MAGDLSSVDAIVEIPRGSRNKYECNPATGSIRLDRVLFSSMHYPGDYGFIPGTRCGDGDPLDVLILVEEPTFPGCRVRIRPIGVLLMEDEKDSDVKILGVPVADPRFAEVADLGDLPHHWLAEVENFFETYKILEGKTIVAEGWRGAREAVLVLQRCWTGPKEPAEAGRRRRRKRGAQSKRPAHGPSAIAPAAQESQTRPPVRLILHPTDFSDRSEFAFRIACTLARDHSARLLLLHVAPSPVMVAGAESVARANDYPDRLKEELRQLGVPDANIEVEYRVEEGDPVREILAVARQMSADLIVMGTHGRTGLGWLLMGSVAEQVVRQAPCPVLTVRTPLPAGSAIAGPAEAPEEEKVS
jgi:inorganic pyrophosphatase